ncbi:hypothetical protein CN093_08790 [Sinorhizobium meliloti]|uniref:AAA family ATPase n=1 Tax=Rhizobium meliloti TaxID=382 RepID=UPI000FD1E3A5|nr:AAA family ATPase [Sinorhizobium meliloti]RVO41350.1 hypothetical protein CN093_08790 [Sinorhizobium meliloti]
MAKINFKVPPLPKERAAVDVALSYIMHGVPVFPCREKTTEGVDYSTGEVVDFVEKSPYTTYGLKDATTSSRIINILFGERHQGAAIGVPTGEKLGAWVLDLDRHANDDGTVRDGHEWLAAQEENHGPLPETARATTANGGTHIFFRHVEGIRNRAAIAPGVDTRGEGGYILAPGSIMADGRRYEWVDWQEDGLPDFADAPEWLVDLVKVKAPAPVEQTKREYTYQPEDSGAARYASRSFDMEMDKLASAPKGQRGQQLFASACSIGEFVAAGLISRSDAEAGLIDAAKSNGLVATDGERKCWDKIKRGLDKTANSPRQIPEREYDNDNTRVDPEAVSRLVEKSRAKAATAASVDEASEPSATEPTDLPVAPKQRARFELTWFDEIEEGKPKETILKGWLGEGEFTTISGLPGTGKSVVTTDLACHIAAGMDWHGLKVKQGLVVYVAAERKKLTERRMMAFRRHHDVHNVPLLVVGGRLDFTRDLKDANDLIAAIREAEAVTGMRCVWVIIDTLTRVFGGGDQNASKDMTKFVNSCDHILAETKAHVTAIHHSAWSGERGKGAIDLDGAVDASFMVKKDGNKHKLVCDGTNDGEEGEVLAFTMKSVQIGVDEEGEPTTAPVVVKAEGGSIADKLRGAVNGHNARAFEILRELVLKEGVDPESPGYPEGALVVSEERWREAVYTDAGDKMIPASKRQRFNRAKKDLASDGSIGHNAIWVWLTPEKAADEEA